jgi:hypothetical protein
MHRNVLPELFVIAGRNMLSVTSENAAEKPGGFIARTLSSRSLESM